MSVLPSRSCDRAINIPAIIDLALVTGLWCLTVIMVNPVGEFPIIDDSVYESIVKHLLETGEYRLSEVSTFPSITTTLWGALFCLPFGVSFTALRISTLTAALLGLLGTYTLVRGFHPRGPTALVATLAVAFNPVYYALSHTFMTDVPFTAMMVWAAVFLIRSLKSSSGLELFCGTLLALAATLSRQIALAAPFAFAGTLLLCRKFERGVIVRALFPGLVCIAGLSWFNNWLALTGRVPAMYGYWTHVLIHVLADSTSFLTQLLSNVYVTLLYLGLFLLPVELFVDDGLRVAAATARTRVGRLAVIFGTAVMTLGIWSRMYSGDSLLLPLDGHVLVKSGIGLLWMRGAEHVPSLPEPFWFALTAGGILGAILFFGMLGALSERVVGVILRRATVTDSEAAMMYLTLCSGLYLLPFLAVGSSDRYVMPCVPLLVVVIALSGIPSESRKGIGAERERWASFILLVMVGIFSVGGTRDYLEWNRLRWRAAYELILNEHVSTTEIDGGDEFNSVYRTRPANVEKAFQEFVDENNLASMISTWSVELRRQLMVMVMFSWRSPTTPYLISFGEVPGYSVVRKYTYRRWISFREQSILVLRKD